MNHQGPLQCRLLFHYRAKVVWKCIIKHPYLNIHGIFLKSNQIQAMSWLCHSTPCQGEVFDKSELGSLAFRSCPTGPAGRGWSSISTSGCWGRLYSRQRSQMSFFNCCKSWKRQTTKRRGAD